MSKQELDKTIEALLFVYGEALSASRIAKITGAKKQDVTLAVGILKERLVKGSGLRIIEKDGMIQLVAGREQSENIEKLFRSKKKEELSRASLEVLACIAYSGPISREEVEEIRGVNSAYIVRTLLMRGLIEETGAQNGAPLYNLSFEALRRLGLSAKEDLPDWLNIQDEIRRAKTLEPQKNA